MKQGLYCIDFGTSDSADSKENGRVEATKLKYADSDCSVSTSLLMFSGF